MVYRERARQRGARVGGAPPSAWRDASPVRQWEGIAVHALWLSDCLVAERPVVAGVQPTSGTADRGPRYTVPAGDYSPDSGCTTLSFPAVPTQSRRCP